MCKDTFQLTCKVNIQGIFPPFFFPQGNALEFFSAWYLRRRTTSTTSSPGSSRFPKWRRQECAQPKFAPTLTRRGLTHYRRKPLSSIHCDYLQSWTKWMENLYPLPPNQGWGNGAFWLLRRFILELGRGGEGWGVAVPFYSVQDRS